MAILFTMKKEEWCVTKEDREKFLGKDYTERESIIFDAGSTSAWEKYGKPTDKPKKIEKLKQSDFYASATYINGMVTSTSGKDWRELIPVINELTTAINNINKKIYENTK